MRFTILLYCFALATSALSRAQSKTLHQEQNQVMNASLGTNDWGLADAACDAKGNVFVTAWNPEGECPADRPLLMFDSAGILRCILHRAARSSVLSAAAPSYQPPYQPIALVSDGGVARLVWSYDGMSLDVFSADAKLRSKTPTRSTGDHSIPTRSVSFGRIASFGSPSMFIAAGPWRLTRASPPFTARKVTCRNGWRSLRTLKLTRRQRWRLKIRLRVQCFGNRESVGSTSATGDRWECIPDASHISGDGVRDFGGGRVYCVR